MSDLKIPQLRRVGARTQLFVEDAPYLIVGGELGNSNASDLDVLNRSLARCTRMNLNAVLLPVYWDRIEPCEGAFDFSLVRGAIDLARLHSLKLVPLWFGTWKNSMSCYAPSWVKRDTKRFERARRSNGDALEIISPACAAACEADARAFAALMTEIRAYDERHRTVIMVQVENEIGMIPDARDHSEASERLYREPVPVAVLERLSKRSLGSEVDARWERAGRATNGSWETSSGRTRKVMKFSPPGS